MEDRWSVITADKVPLPAAKRQVLELSLVSSSLIKSQPLEEIEEQLFLLQSGGPMLHLGVVLEEHPMVVNIVEVFPDARSR